MRPLVHSGFGTPLRVSGQVLEVSDPSEGRRETFPAHRLPFDSVVVEGNSGTISFEAARFLAAHDIPLTFLRWDGSVLSALLPRGPVAGELKLAQFASHNHPRKRSETARSILEVKLAKSVELLRFLSRFYPCDPKPVEAEDICAVLRPLKSRELVIENEEPFPQNFGLLENPILQILDLPYSSGPEIHWRKV